MQAQGPGLRSAKVEILAARPVQASNVCIRKQTKSFMIERPKYFMQIFRRKTYFLPNMPCQHSRHSGARSTRATRTYRLGSREMLGHNCCGSTTTLGFKWQTELTTIICCSQLATVNDVGEDVKSLQDSLSLLRCDWNFEGRNRAGCELTSTSRHRLNWSAPTINDVYI